MVKTASTMMPLGTPAIAFTLPDFDGKAQSLESNRGDKSTVIVFMCNHCPYVKHVAPELAKIADEYKTQGVNFIGISSNDVSAHPEDSPAMMKQEAKKQGYHFAYLYDETQEVAHAYKAACTPDFFVFNSDLKLAYRGQMDDSRPKTDRPLNGADLRAALDSLVAGNPVQAGQKPSIGCNIKWKPGMEPDYFLSSQM